MSGSETVVMSIRESYLGHATEESDSFHAFRLWCRRDSYVQADHCL
ncbi:hypothetical protein COLO4_03832 [Corchorus olitorius]|uniref:Uncharacterized protein n=1 Tax=Corchorus olitorius TaxID=93759 RepID=A0A1R3KWF9_9ROSI|nr:hypothetical protein COLO4_03832 [Corchorus olitorius]